MFGFEMIGNYDHRKVNNTEIDGGIVDTVLVTDSTKPFETGIAHPAYNGGSWIIVELYEDLESASSGHDKWIEIMKKKPDKLVDVNQCEAAQFAAALGVSVNGTYPRKNKK